VIGSLRGRLAHKGTQDLLIDVHGVGYRVSIPLSTFYRLGNLGSDIALLVHTHVREDALQLYGFLTADEQVLFERLIAISGVGPRLALSILSGIEVSELIAALRASDVARLTRVPGVGKKTAERLVLELKDKLQAFAATTATPDAPSPSPLRDDVVSALANLGYPRADADRAVERALKTHAQDRFEDLLRETLRLLAGGR
jgi:holliday junction DNA helicase RuvA